MPFLDLQREILDQELCTRCGSCVAVCPKQMLGIESNGEPFSLFDEEIINSNCGDCNLCMEVCPGKNTDTVTSEKRIFGRVREKNERWTGIFKNSFLVSSTDPEILKLASAGGAATSLLITALRINLVEAVIVIGRNKNKPWIPQAIITNNEDIVKHSAQASYCLSPNLQLLYDTPYNRIGIVCVPCEIQAINKMKNSLNEKIARIAQKIIFTVELGCASSTKIEGTEYLIQKKLGLELNKVKKVLYRDGKYPGQFTVYTKDENKHELPFYELVDTFKKFKTHRCLSCPDWWSGLADISIADGDPNIYATSMHKVDSKQNSTVIVRTDVGKELLEQAIKLNMINVEQASFIPEDSLGLQRKRYRSSNYANKYPDRVPDRPVEIDILDDFLDDDELIARMSGITNEKS